MPSIFFNARIDWTPTTGKLNLNKAHRTQRAFQQSLKPPRRCQSRQTIHCMQSSDPRPFKNVFELTAAVHEASGSEKFSALNRVLKLTMGHALCNSTPALKEKFGVEEDNDQLVVCATELWSNNQVWWNEARTKKPQTFKSESLELPDSTDDGKNCDFCRWDILTAADTFGRVENESCVSSSNLFKFAFPCHGLILFKHHQPLTFSCKQVADLLAAAAEWFRLASQEHPHLAQPHPLLLWNCLPRAGASQFHGHAQTTLTETPTPAALALSRSFTGFAAEWAGQSYTSALREAYQSVGLLRSCSCQGRRAVCYASLAPTKDMEVVVMGDSLACPAFATLLHGALRTLIDQLAVTSFNVGILNISAETGEGLGAQPIVARLVSRGPLSSKASDFGGLEVFGGASIGHTDPYSVISALDRQMQGVEGYVMLG